MKKYKQVDIDKLRQQMKSVKNDRNSISSFGASIGKAMTVSSEQYLKEYKEDQVSETNSIVNEVMTQVDLIQGNVQQPEKGVVGYLKGLFSKGGGLTSFSSRAGAIEKIHLMKNKLESQKEKLEQNLVFVQESGDELAHLNLENNANIIVAEERLDEERKILSELAAKAEDDASFEVQIDIKEQYDVVQRWERRVENLKEMKSDIQSMIYQQSGFRRAHDDSIEAIDDTINNKLGKVSRMIANNSVLETMSTANEMVNVLTEGGDRLAIELSNQSVKVSEQLNETLYKTSNLEVKKTIGDNAIKTIKNEHEKRKEYTERTKAHRIESDKIDAEYREAYENVTGEILTDIIDISTEEYSEK